jgi:tRNA(Arg) A34 adenosine deaminase TadA
MTPSPFMSAALELARASIAAGGGPFGAVVVRAGIIVGRGSNQVVASRDPTAHAEVLAIRDAARALVTHDLAGCQLFTSCEPCPMCFGAIHWARLACVHFACDRRDAAAAGFDDEAFWRELARPLEERALPTVQDGREQGLAVFRAWLANPARVPY